MLDTQHSPLAEAAKPAAIPTDAGKAWTTVCQLSDLVVGSGVSALVGQRQIAIFSLKADGSELYAVGNYDPIGQANVLYRGIVGCIDGEPVVASPLYKQHFSLKDGRCLEDGSHAVAVFEVRLTDQDVQLLVPAV